MAKKRKLNEAPLNVWGQHLLNEENNRLAERIMELDQQSELSKEEENELSVLISMEKGLLVESKQNAENMKKIIHQYYKILDKLADDNRLITIFNIRMGNMMDSGEIKKPEEVIDIYKTMMEEDMDVDGHEKLTEEFNELMKQFEHEEKGGCDDPECMYCSEVSDQEYEVAYNRLTDEGFFSPAISDEEKLTTLMITLIRLEQYIKELEDELGDEEEGDDDEV